MSASMWRHIFPRSKTVVARAGAAAPAPPVPVPSSSAPPSQASPALSLEQLDESFHRLVFGLPPARNDEASPVELAMLRRLDLLSSRFDLRSLPRLPTVLPQLLQTLRSDQVAGRELAKLVGRDPLMVGEVMRATSTVFYRSAQPISSLRQAVVLLGQDGLRRVITQHVMKPILQANAGNLGHSAGKHLWGHAERCAHACAWLGRHFGCDSFEAYLAGIIRHAGTGAVVRLLDQLMPGETAPPLSSSFVRNCSTLANRLSLQAARQWELPLRVLGALTECQSPLTPAGSALGRVLSMADSLASARVLVESGEFAGDADLSQHWPGSAATGVIARCQHDLERHFALQSIAS